MTQDTGHSGQLFWLKKSGNPVFKTLLKTEAPKEKNLTFRLVVGHNYFLLEDYHFIKSLCDY